MEQRIPREWNCGFRYSARYVSDLRDLLNETTITEESLLEFR